MIPIGYHVVGRLSDGRVIAPTPPERRLVARGLRLLAFNLPDTHLHIEHRAEHNNIRDQ